MSPLILFRRVAVAEAVTWALLLVGMFLKYVIATTDLGVRVFGMLHGVVFVAYCVTTVVVAVDQRWRAGRTLLGLVSAVPPFTTLWFEGYAERKAALDTAWRLREQDGTSPIERATGTLLRKPLLGAGVGLVAVAVLTGAALLVGPPTS